MTDLVERALEFLRESDNYVEDARKHASTGSTVVSALLGEELPQAPRWQIQQAVTEALAILDEEQL
jgi:hypothetical protein